TGFAEVVTAIEPTLTPGPSPAGKGVWGKGIAQAHQIRKKGSKRFDDRKALPLSRLALNVPIKLDIMQIELGL
ncbi:MAG: hypothetical protein ACK44E_09920, partial [Anaerolineales bacterium]